VYSEQYDDSAKWCNWLDCVVDRSPSIVARVLLIVQLGMRFICACACMYVSEYVEREREIFFKWEKITWYQ